MAIKTPIERLFLHVKHTLRFVFFVFIFYTQSMLPTALSIPYLAFDQAQAAEATLIIDAPLYDSPYNTRLSVKNPSMAQSLNASKAFYQLSHYSLQKVWKDNKDGTLISILLFDAFSVWLPLSMGWLHEEWHRSVMGQYDISSRNQIYNFPLFEETILVDRIADADLIKLKKEHPDDFIRLHTVGMEAQNQLNLAIEKEHFFQHSSTMDFMLLWMNNINILSYIDLCSTTKADNKTRKLVAKEDANPLNRDFTGFDCNAWVYDLYRPNEPYADRGPHPSGVGIDRYISFSKLTNEQQQYLRKQYYFSFLNFANPFLLGKTEFSGTNPFNQQPLKWNANIKHYLTPFGFSIHLHGFVSTLENNFHLTLKNYFNKKHYFPGASIEWINIRTSIGKLRVKNTLSADWWLQPKQLAFNTARSKAGGRLAFESAFMLNHQIQPYWQISYKTNGWLEANTYLSQSFNVMAGLRYQI